MKPTPIEVLTRHAQDRPNDTAFIFHDKVWTYEMIAAESERLARGMMAQGVKPGDRVCLHMMNRPEFIVAYYACFRLGAIAAPLRTAFTFSELEPILQRLAPALYIGDAALYGNIAPVSASILPHDRRFIVGAAQRVQDVASWETLLGGAGTDNSIAPAAHEPAVLITTSGTTGTPKFVVHTASTLTESTEMLNTNWALLQDDVIAVPFAMAHSSGLLTFLAHIQLRSRFVLIESFDADVVLDAMERYGCTRHGAFPAQYAALLDSQRRKPRNLRALRLCLTGGDACPVDLQLQVTSAFGAPLYNVWAATEAAGNMKFGLRPGPVMRLGKDTEIRLVDDNDNDVADGEIGELLLRAANIFDSYWDDPKATADSLKGGWYHTGDLMQRGEGDELLFVARKKDIIIRGGTNISPMEVEQAIIASHPAVAEAAAIGVADGALGQRIIGFISLAKGANAAVVSEILDNLTTRLAAYKIPERLVVLSALPRNALSKVDRKALQAIVAGAPASSATAADQNIPVMAGRGGAQSAESGGRARRTSRSGAHA
jgi:long-chain acyl-CoA synthetase